MVDLMANVGVVGGKCIYEGKLSAFGRMEWKNQWRHLDNVDHVESRWEGGDA